MGGGTREGSLPFLSMARAQGPPVRTWVVQEDGYLVQCFQMNLMFPGGRYLETPEEAVEKRGCFPEQTLRGLHSLGVQIARSPQATYINYDAWIG